MKKLIPTVLSFTAVSLVLSACGGGAEAEPVSTGKGPAGLVKAGEVSFCTDPEYPPMEYYADGSSGDPIGFDSDAAVALAELWGAEPKFVPMAFDGLMPGLQAERCDVLWTALYMSPDRLEVADGTPYLKTGPGLITPSGDDSIKSADDLSGKTVAVQGGGSNEETLRALSAEFEASGRSGIKVQPYPKTSETVAAVMNGKADALIETDVAVVDMIAKSNGKLQSVPDVFEATTDFGVFTVKGSELSAAVKDGVRELATNGTLAEIAEEYGLDPDRIITGE